MSNFLTKVSQMLDDADPSVVEWAPTGLTFLIKQPEVFAETVLPQYFRHSKLSSFVRQLNSYSFNKLRYDVSRGLPEGWLEFRHPEFTRDRPELRTKIPRKVPSADPNLLAMEGRLASLERLVHGLAKDNISLKAKIAELERQSIRYCCTYCKRHRHVRTWHDCSLASAFFSIIHLLISLAN